MSYGIEALSNIDGRVLIDTELPNMIYAGKGEAFSYEYGWYDTSVSGLCWNYKYILPNAPSEVSVTTPTKKPTVFVYTDPGVYFHMSEHYLYDFGDGYQVWVMSYWSSVEVQPTLYTFYDSVGEPSSSDTYGMRLYNSSSELIYDTGWKISQVKDIITIGGSSGSTSQASSTISKPAVVHYNASLKIDAPGGYWLYSNNMLTHDTNNLFSVALHWTHGVQAGQPPANDYYFYDTSSRQLAVIDGADYD